MKKVVLSILALIAFVSLSAQTLNPNKVYVSDKKVESRQEVIIPDVEGYQVLKCDFHMHTMFSDGSVWPAFRVQEAWRDGLDAIAITDHIEYRPFAQYLNADFNTSYGIAKPAADGYGLILIRGTEITRKQGEIGHFNALFIKDANLIPNDDPFIAIANARAQGAFVLFNHPGWAVDTCLITPFQQKLMDKQMIDGIEVFNHLEFYPRVISWCVDMKYPMFANSDEHGIISEAYSGLRPMTLVLATEKSEDGVKEALFAGRTIAFSDNTFAGPEEMLIKLFRSCVSISELSHNEKNTVYTYRNNSSLRFVLEVNGSLPKVIPPMSTIRVTIKNGKDATITLLNMWSYENKQPQVQFKSIL